MAKLKPYRVMWEIDVDAGSPREAAIKALEIQRDPESTAVVFKVQQKPGGWEQVDLDLTNGVQ